MPVEGRLGHVVGVVDALDAQQRLRVHVLPRPESGLHDVAAGVDVGEHVAGAGGGGVVGGQGRHVHAAHRRRHRLDEERVRADAQPVHVRPRQPGVAAERRNLRAGPQQQRFEQLDLESFGAREPTLHDAHRLGPFAEDEVRPREPPVHPQADALGALRLRAVLQQLPRHHGVVVHERQPAERHVAPLLMQGRLRLPTVDARPPPVQRGLPDQPNRGGLLGGAVAVAGPFLGGAGPRHDFLGAPFDQAEQRLARRDAGPEVGGCGLGGGVLPAERFGGPVDEVAGLAAAALMQGEVPEQRVVAGVRRAGPQGAGVQAGLRDVGGGNHRLDGVQPQGRPGGVVGGELRGQAQVAGRLPPMAQATRGPAVRGELPGQFRVRAVRRVGALVQGADVVTGFRETRGGLPVQTAAPGRRQLREQHRPVHRHREIDGRTTRPRGHAEQARGHRVIQALAFRVLRQIPHEMDGAAAVEDGHGLGDAPDAVGKRGEPAPQRRRPRGRQGNGGVRSAPMIRGRGLEHLLDAAGPTARDAAQRDGRRRVDGGADGGVDELADLGHLQRRNRGEDVGDAGKREQLVVRGTAELIAGQDDRDAAVEESAGHARQLAQGRGVRVVRVVDDDDRRRTGNVDVPGQGRAQPRDGRRRRDAAGARIKERRLLEGFRGGGARLHGDVLQQRARAIRLPRQHRGVDALETRQIRQHIADDGRLSGTDRSRENRQRPRAGPARGHPLDQGARRGAADLVLQGGTGRRHDAPMLPAGRASPGRRRRPAGPNP